MMRNEKRVTQFAVSAEIVQAADGTDKPAVYKARLVSGAPNRRGDVVVVSGMDVSAFKRNPIVQLEHGYGDARLPIARATDIQFGKDANGDAVIDAEYVFDMGDPIAREVERKWSAGFLNAVSVGFNVLKAELIDPKDDSWFAPLRFTQTELIEFSIVNIGADATALRQQSLTYLPERAMISLAETEWGISPEIGG